MSDSTAPVVILGDGACGLAAAEHLRLLDAEIPIQVISDDPNPAYFRAALTNYLMGELRAEQIFATPPDFFTRHRVNRRLGRVVRVDAANQSLTLNDGQQLGYRNLVLATGARPRPLGVPGEDLDGVTPLRTLEHAQQILDRVARGRCKRAVIVGGGPLALEWVHGLRERGAHVTLLLRTAHLMRTQLDKKGSDRILARLRKHGVDVVNDTIAEVRGKHGRVVGLALKSSGKVLACDFVGAAVGIVPNTEFLEGSGVVLDRRGIPVNAAMETNVRGVFAGGDAAVVEGTVLGLWEPARKQGKVIGRNLAGRDVRYQIGVHYFATRLFDLDFAYAMASGAKPDSQVVVDASKGKVHYQTLHFESGRLVGLHLLGERDQRTRLRGRLLRKLVAARAIVPPDIRERLLDPAFDLKGWASPQLDKQRKQRQAQREGFRTSALRRSQAINVRRAHRRGDAKPRSGRLRASLYRDGQLLHTFRGSCAIGRDPQGNDLVLDDKHVAAHQCMVEHAEGVFSVRNLGRVNPTRVDGRPTGQRMPLEDGDVLRLGSTALTIRVTDAVQRPSIQREASNRKSMTGLPAQAVSKVSLTSQALTLRIAGEAVTVSSVSIVLGRDAAADHQLANDDVDLFHAQVLRSGSEWFVRDLGSASGTFLNGARLTVPGPLRDGDELRLGGAVVHVLDGAGARTSADASPASAPSSPPAEARRPTPRPTPQPTPPAAKPAVAKTESAKPAPAPPKPAPAAPKPAPAPPKPAAPAPGGYRKTEVIRQPAMVAFLVFTDPSGEHHDVPVTRPVTLGRDPARSTHLFPQDAKLSGLHCSLAPADGGVDVTDQSTNGTFVDGARLSKGVAVTVRPGQRMTLGLSSAIVELRPASKPVATQVIQTLERVLVAHVHAGDGTVHRVRLSKPVVVGRDPARADLLPQGDNTISGAHARLEMASDGLRLTDLGSSNGTTVDGRKVVPHTPEVVEPGALILLGSTRVDLEWDEA